MFCKQYRLHDAKMWQPTPLVFYTIQYQLKFIYITPKIQIADFQLKMSSILIGLKLTDETFFCYLTYIKGFVKHNKEVLNNI